MQLFALVDRPWTPRHIAFHFAFCVCLFIDGVLGILSLGFRHTTFAEMAVDGGLDWIFDHKAEAEKMAGGQGEAIKHAIAKELGINPNAMREMTQQDVLDMIEKEDAKQRMFNAVQDEEKFH